METVQSVDLEKIERDAKAEFRSSQALRDEFIDDESIYVAYRKAEAKGLVRVLGKTKSLGASNV